MAALIRLVAEEKLTDGRRGCRISHSQERVSGKTGAADMSANASRQ